MLPGINGEAVRLQGIQIRHDGIRRGINPRKESLIGGNDAIQPATILEMGTLSNSERKPSLSMLLFKALRNILCSYRGLWISSFQELPEVYDLTMFRIMPALLIQHPSLISPLTYNIDHYGA